MRILKLLFLPLAFAAAAPSYAQSPYIDPALRALLEPKLQQAIRQSDEPSPAAGVAIRKSAFESPRVALFAKLRSEAAITELNAAGARIGSRIGDIVTAEIPLDKLATIIKSSSFHMLEAAHDVTLAHDTSMRAIRADLVRRAAGGTWNGTAGRDVIVGVYDTGLDFTHEDFLDALGQTRVLALWDQTDTNSGAPPAGFGYGRFCSGADIQQSVQNPGAPVCPQRDLNGHGTHVMGTAAGDGSAVGIGGTAFTFAGVAPLADLMVVKGGNGTFSEGSIIDGLVWLEREARARNKPMVVNLSLGSQAGPHDGSRLYEEAVDNLSRAGFVVVFSAGNEGSNQNDRNPDGTQPARNPNYFHGSGLPGTSRDFTIEISPYTPIDGACNEFVQISLWYEATDMLDLMVLRPDGGIVGAPFRQIREQDSPAGNVRIDNASGGVNARNNAYEADIRFNDCGSGATPAAGIWTLRISSASPGSGKPYHFWMWAQSLGGALLARGRQGFDNHYVVSSPGNARSAITVGAFASKLCWNSPAKPEGPVCFVTMEQIGDLARFSSGGPARDGRLKPEITAPGLGIASSRSRNAMPAANRILSDGVHWVNQGTSMAAPHVTGAIALMLQARPTLTHADIRDILSRTSDQDQLTARVYDNSFDAVPRFWWGHGKLNICASLGAIGVAGGAAGPVIITPMADTIPVNATTRFFSCSPTGATIAFHSTNPAVATIDADGTVRALQTGSALLIASSGTFADTAQVVVTEPANLRVALDDIAPDSVTPSPRGTRLPLLSTVLRVNGFENIRVTQLGYRLTGADPNARFVLIADANRNGRIDFGERTIASRAASLTGVPIQIDVALDSVIVAMRDSLNLIAAIELSGAAPNRGSFTAEFVPAATRSIGLRSLATNRLETVTTSLASSAALTTVLTGNETFSLSENPVRSGRVVFNFSEAPRLAGIYTLTGRLVSDLKSRAGTSGSVAWDLTNDNGARVATGVYLAIFDFGSGPIREKLFVVRGSR
ncbi:MAG: S8 family serine peptidase [Gemmatimonadota bacterium]